MKGFPNSKGNLDFKVFVVLVLGRKRLGVRMGLGEGMERGESF